VIRAAQFTEASPVRLAGPRLRAGRATHVWLTLVVGAATVAATLLSEGNLVATIAPVVLGAVLWAIWVAPLRVTLGVAMFLGLAVDRPGDAEGQWLSPFSTLGGLMFHNLNHVIAIDQLKFSAVFALVCYLLVIRVHRLLTGRDRDTTGSLVPAAPMRWAMLAALVSVLGAAAWGLGQGGDGQMVKIQVQAYLQLLAVAYLFSVSLRERDYRWLAGVIVAAACSKALVALWVRATVATYIDQFGVLRELDYATNHGDSLVFACATAALIGPLFHRPTKRQISWFLLLMPLIVAGVVANDRRIAWVQIALVVAAFLFMNPGSVFTRRVARVVILSSPLLFVYGVVGWSSPSRVFAPVGFVRTIVQPERTDGSLDRSTLFRDIENFNLVSTFRAHPVAGSGFGLPFSQVLAGDDLSGFKEYFFLPHNSMIGLWSFTGLFGFTGILSPVLVGLFLSARAHKRATSSLQAVASTAAIGCLFAYVVHLWGDIGFSEAPTIFLVGLAMAVAGQLAMSTGAWPARWREHHVEPSRSPRQDKHAWV